MKERKKEGKNRKKGTFRGNIRNRGERKVSPFFLRDWYIGVCECKSYVLVTLIVMLLCTSTETRF